MWGRWATKLAIVLLNNSRIGNDDRQLLTSALLVNLGALPLRARIVVDDAGQIFVNELQMTVESARQMHDGSKAMLTNFARKFVREQVTYMAILKGVHENTSPEQGLFAKAALWFYQEEEDLYRRLAQLEDGGNSEEHTL